MLSSHDVKVLWYLFEKRETLTNVSAMGVNQRLAADLYDFVNELEVCGKESDISEEAWCNFFNEFEETEKVLLVNHYKKVNVGANNGFKTKLVALSDIYSDYFFKKSQLSPPDEIKMELPPKLFRALMSHKNPTLTMQTFLREGLPENIIEGVLERNDCQTLTFLTLNPHLSGVYLNLIDCKISNANCFHTNKAEAVSLARTGILKNPNISEGLVNNYAVLQQKHLHEPKSSPILIKPNFYGDITVLYQQPLLEETFVEEFTSLEGYNFFTSLRNSATSRDASGEKCETLTYQVNYATLLAHKVTRQHAAESGVFELLEKENDWGELVDSREAVHISGKESVANILSEGNLSPHFLNFIYRHSNVQKSATLRLAVLMNPNTPLTVHEEEFEGYGREAKSSSSTALTSYLCHFFSEKTLQKGENLLTP